MTHPLIKTPESGKTGVLRACLDLLTYEHIWHRRWNTSAFAIEAQEGANGGKQKRRFVRSGVKGDADILATPQAHNGIQLNAHRSTGKQRPEQKDFQKEVEAQGHIYLLVNNVDMLRDWLREQKVIRG